MLTKIEGIVLQIIKHNDKNNIVTLYTRQRGRVSFLSSAASTKRGKVRNARLGLMSLVESVVNFKENRDLQYLGQVESPVPWRNLYFDPMKSAIAFFMAEFLNKLLNSTECDPPLWSYLIESLHHLDRMERGIANFHICFLIRLLPFMGIEPDLTDYRDGCRFDMIAGTLTDPMAGVTHNNVLDSAVTARLRVLRRMNFRNMHLYRFSVEERRYLLSKLMHYYSLHLPIREEMKSLEVLQTLFC